MLKVDEDNKKGKHNNKKKKKRPQLTNVNFQIGFRCFLNTAALCQPNYLMIQFHPQNLLPPDPHNTLQMTYKAGRRTEV